MIILSNVYIDVHRSLYSSAGSTDTARPHLQRIEAHLTRIKDAQLRPMPTSAFTAQYELYVGTDVDIQKGDIVANIVRKDNNKPFFPGQSNEIYSVTDAVNSAPGFMEYRDVSIERLVGGGPIQ